MTGPPLAPDALLDEGPFAVLAWRRQDDWRVVTATPNLETVIGYAAEDLLSGSIEFADIIHEQDSPAVFERLGLAATQGDADFTIEYRVVTPTGEERRVWDHTRILRDESKEPYAFVSYLLDASDDPRASSASAFVAHVSHEVRTPLSGILGLVDALGRTQLDGEQAEIVEAIEEAGASLLQLVNNVLDLSKIEARAMELVVSDFRVGELCIAAERLFSRRAAAKGVRLATRGQAMDIRVRGDAGRLRQILFNLVSNAVKFTEEGAVEIAWWTEPVLDSGRLRVGLTVADSGPGMDEETLRRIFESYRQASAQVGATYGGTGLGLAIAKQLAALMGGRLFAESQLGVGSKFHFECEFEPSADEQPELAALEREEADAAARAAIAARAPRILAAEDASANQRVLELMLTPIGAEVVIARDGREAVERYAAERFDLVLMDSRMPRLGGIEATSEIRRMEREGGRVRAPLMALTAETLNDTLDAFRAAGADAVLPKPFEPGRLLRLIAELLDQPSGARPARPETESPVGACAPPSAPAPAEGEGSGGTPGGSEAAPADSK